MAQVPAGNQAHQKWIGFCKRLISPWDKRQPTPDPEPSPASIENFPADRFAAQVEQIAGSQLFQGSEALTRLLRYLGLHTLNAPANHIKEYQIATEVLGRSADFDPQTDSCVRVQVGRLRNKLAEYYESIGAHDPVLIKIPKGGYTLSFEIKVIEKESPVESAVVSQVTAPPTRKQYMPVIVTAVFTFLITAVAILYHFRGMGPRTSTALASTSPASPALATFWGPFLRDPVGPYVVYSNATFIGSPITGMRYYIPGRDRDKDTEQHYTGVGELVGSVRLAQMFDRFGRELRLKRAGLFTLDDSLNNDPVFLGSPTENSPLDKITATHEFVLGQVPGHKNGVWGFVPAHRRPGDPAGYPATPPAAPGSEDYAVIALEQGLNPSRRIVILEGISTLSTEAAVEFSCNETAMQSLLAKLGVTPGAPVPPFEALLRVKVAGDVPLGEQLVDVRRTSN